MRNLFNMVMGIVSSLLGVLVILMGGVWILQGLNISFNGPINGGPPSFMVGDTNWVIYGAIAVFIGVCQVIWTNTRPE